MKKLLLLAVCAVMSSLSLDAAPKPGAALLKRLQDGDDVIGIIHWGPNTYYNQQWGHGNEDPARLWPTNFNPDQIAQACAAGGLKGLVIVAKHHDGTCLWPTATTTHRITESPYRYKGEPLDYVGEMATAIRKAGMKVGIYCSPWDRNNADYANDNYVTTYHNQVKELLTNYGEIFEMWFDGANGGSGYYGGETETTRSISGDTGTYYKFGELFAWCRAKWPNLTIFAGERDDSDFRWPGNEQGYVLGDCRATIVTTGGYINGAYQNGAYNQNMMASGSTAGEYFRVPEADFPMRTATKSRQGDSWFYTAEDDGHTKSAAFLMNRYLNSVGNGATMDIGISPMPDGQLSAEDVEALRGFKVIKDAFFAHEVADPTTEPVNFVVMSEDITDGEHIGEWHLRVNNSYDAVHGAAIGYRRMRTFGADVQAPMSVTTKDFAGNATNIPVTVKYYYVDRELINLVNNATANSPATDVSKWDTNYDGPQETDHGEVNPDLPQGDATVWTAGAMSSNGDTFDKRGNLVYAFCRQQSAGWNTSSLTVNDIGFTGIWYTQHENVKIGGESLTTYFEFSPDLNNCSEGLGDENVTGDYGLFLKNGWWYSGSGNVTCTLKRLTAGKTYLVQFVTHWNNGSGRSLWPTDDTTKIAYTKSADCAYGSYLTSVFTATNVTQTFEFAHTGNEFVVNGFQVRELAGGEEPVDPPVPEPPPVYALTIPAKAGLALDLVKTNSIPVEAVNSVYSIVSNTEVTVTFSAASGYELDGNDGVVVKTIVSDYSFVDSDYPAVKEQGGGEGPEEPPSGGDDVELGWTAGPMSATGDTIDTRGKLVYAFSWYNTGNGGSYTPEVHAVCGVDFTGIVRGCADKNVKLNGELITTYYEFSPDLGSYGGNLGDEGVSDESGYATFLKNGWWCSASGNVTCTLKRLTLGKTYLVQFVTHWNNGSGRSLWPTDDTTKIAYTKSADCVYGSYLTGIFKADGETHSFEFAHTGSEFVINGLQVREVTLGGGEDPEEPAKSGFILIVR